MNSHKSLVIDVPGPDSFGASGRRTFFEYRDLGLSAASAGVAGATSIRARERLPKATGWHFHECDVQFIYVLSGWADMEFEDGTQTRVEAGTALTIPGGLRHIEYATSDDLQTIEVTIPADMGTVACDPPTPG